MIYHAASHPDVKEAMDYIKKVKKDTLIVGIGVSLGAAILANVLLFFNIISIWP